MKNTPIDYEIVTQKIKESGLSSVGTASIREIKKLVDNIQKATGDKFIRMEMGIPGLPPAQIGVEAEIEALRAGKASIYPDIWGFEDLKNEISDALVQGRLSCKSAWDIATRFNVHKMKISGACEAMGIRIKHCQLGAF